MSNVVILKKLSPVRNVVAEPISESMPKTLTKGQWAVNLNEGITLPDDYKNCGWLDSSEFRDGMAYTIQDDEGLVAVYLNNVLRHHLDGSISYRRDRQILVKEIVAKFKSVAYIEYSDTGITLLVRGEALQNGRGAGAYRYVEVLDAYQDKLAPITGHLHPEGQPEPLEGSEELEWLFNYIMTPEAEQDDALGEAEIHSILDKLSDERVRLISAVENGIKSESPLSDENQLAIINTLFDQLMAVEYFPFSLLDGFTEGE